MELSLKVLDGASAGREIKVPTSKFFIGRADDCHLRPKSDAISRHHCVIMLKEGSATIRDFGSRNGTFINEEKVEGDRELKNGDKLRVGQLRFEVQLTQSIGGQKAPKVKDVKEAAARTADRADPKGENDVSRWLQDDETSHSETRRLEDVAAEENSETIISAGASPALQDTTPEKDQAAEPERSTIAGKKTFGKLPPVPQKGPKDSREAAAEMLKKLFKNR